MSLLFGIIENDILGNGGTRTGCTAHFVLGQTDLITWCSDFFRKIKERPTGIKIKM